MLLCLVFALPCESTPPPLTHADWLCYSKRFPHVAERFGLKVCAPVQIDAFASHACMCSSALSDVPCRLRLDARNTSFLLFKGQATRSRA